MLPTKNLIMGARCCLLRYQFKPIRIIPRHAAAYSTNLTKGKWNAMNDNTLQMMRGVSSRYQTNISTQLAVVDRLSRRRNFSTTRKQTRYDVDYTLHETVLNAANANYHVSYVDEGDKNNPVVLCLHGMPGCHKDLLPILSQLVDGGTRVILFNLPGVGYSWHLEGAPYDYSHLSKARLVEALLSHLGISKVDMLVCESASGHAGFELCANTDLIKNATLAAVWHMPLYGSFGALMLDIIYYTLKFPVSRRLIGSLMISIFRKLTTSQILKTEPLYRVAIEGRTWNYKQAAADLKKMNDKGLSVLVLGVYNDPFVHPHVVKGLMDILGIAEEDRLTYTKERTWQPAYVKGKVNPLKYGITFEKSSHWIPRSHPDIVSSAILDLLKAAKRIQ